MPVCLAKKSFADRSTSAGVWEVVVSWSVRLRCAIDAKSGELGRARGILDPPIGASSCNLDPPCCCYKPAHSSGRHLATTVRETPTNRTHQHDEQIRVARSRNRLRTRSHHTGLGSEHCHPTDYRAGRATSARNLQT